MLPVFIIIIIIISIIIIIFIIINNGIMMMKLIFIIIITIKITIFSLVPLLGEVLAVFDHLSQIICLPDQLVQVCQVCHCVSHKPSVRKSVRTVPA